MGGDGDVHIFRQRHLAIGRVDGEVVARELAMQQTAGPQLFHQFHQFQPERQPSAAIAASSGRIPSRTGPASVVVRTGRLTPPSRTEPVPECRAGGRVIGGAPMKLATKVEAGRRWISEGVPICSMRPAFLTKMRSAIVIASTRSWVT